MTSPICARPAALAVLLCALAGSAAGAQERVEADAADATLVVEVADSIHGGPIQGFAYVLSRPGSTGSGTGAGIVRRGEDVDGTVTVPVPAGRYELALLSSLHRVPPRRSVVLRPGAADTVRYLVPAFADLHAAQVAERARRWTSGEGSPCGWTPEDDRWTDTTRVAWMRDAVIDLNRALVEEGRISGPAFEQMSPEARVVEIRDRRICRALVDGLGPEMAERFRSGTERVADVHRIGPYYAVGHGPTPLAGIVRTGAGGTVLFRADTMERIPVGLHGI